MVRPVLVLVLGFGVVIALCAGPMGAATAIGLAQRQEGRHQLWSARGVDALPAFAGRTVSGGRLNDLRSLWLVAAVGAGAPAPTPEPVNR
jgi:hypothetical protein